MEEAFLPVRPEGRQATNFQQDTNDFDVPVLDGGEQRRFPGHHRGIGLGTAVEQKFHDVEMTFACGGEQRRVAFRIYGGGQRRVFRQQSPGLGQIAGWRCAVQRRRSVRADSLKYFAAGA